MNRLPVLLLPGDVFATRAPDPVLQQVESFADGLVSANDCLRPVSRYFDRITRRNSFFSPAEGEAVLTDLRIAAGDVGLCQMFRPRHGTI